jgi:hypothetical protein
VKPLSVFQWWARAADRHLLEEIGRSTVEASGYRLEAEMNRASILPLAFLLATASGIAQNVLRPRAIGADCPVDMRATHSTPMPVRMTAKGAPQNGSPLNGQKTVLERPAPAINQQIHLGMTSLVARDIVSAVFTARGFSSKPRAINTAGQGPDLRRSIKVVVDLKGNGQASSDLSLRDFTAVTAIDLDAITYADGSTWRNSSPAACRVIPEGMMLVASAH